MTHTQIITLTTDFGLADEYVATMKGVILTISASANIIDICHTIPPQNIQAAAFTFNRARNYFPAGTIHLVVIDPGVGTRRKLLAIHAADQYFIGPDNGVFTQVLQDSAFKSVRVIDRPDLYMNTISATFHGRDIMAPVAAHLGCGIPYDELGPELDPAECVLLKKSTVVPRTSQLEGTVIHIDHFGNVCSNLHREHLKIFPNLQNIRISCNSTRITGISNSYTDAHENAPLAHFDSHDNLEIAVNGGSAAENLGISLGDTVLVTQTD